MQHTLHRLCLLKQRPMGTKPIAYMDRRAYITPQPVPQTKATIIAQNTTRFFGVMPSLALIFKQAAAPPTPKAPGIAPPRVESGRHKQSAKNTHPHHGVFFATAFS